MVCIFSPLYGLPKRGQVERSNDRVSKLCKRYSRQCTYTNALRIIYSPGDTSLADLSSPAAERGEETFCR